MKVIGVTERNSGESFLEYIVAIDCDEMRSICRDGLRHVRAGSEVHLHADIDRLRVLDKKRESCAELARRLRAHADLLDAEQKTVENLVDETGCQPKIPDPDDFE